jgi:hypothetical protein
LKNNHDLGTPLFSGENNNAGYFRQVRELVKYCNALRRETKLKEII